MLIPILLAAGGLPFAFEHSTLAGKIVLALLAVVSIFSWSIMITKLRVVRFAQKQTARFRAAFRKDRQPLRLFENRASFPGAPLFNVYRASCVAIPAMFGYNFLVTSIRAIIVEMDNFAAELASEFEHKYVDHSAREPEFRR